jgi:hypothetical protein
LGDPAFLDDSDVAIIWQNIAFSVAVCRPAIEQIRNFIRIECVAEEEKGNRSFVNLAASEIDRFTHWLSGGSSF